MIESFLETAKNYSFFDIFSKSISNTGILQKKSDIGIDWTYAMMHLFVQRIVVDLLDGKSRKSLLDVGSMFSFVSFASTFYDVTYLEPRISNLVIDLPGVCKISGFKGEAQSLAFSDGQFNVVTSLHAIEHFGLGRYGDEIDYFGDYKGVIEFARVLSSGGSLVTAVPAAISSRLEFNSQRVYAPEDFDRIISEAGLKKEFGLIVYPPGHHPSGIVAGDTKTLEYFPVTNTPPVYICVSRKP